MSSLIAGACSKQLPPWGGGILGKKMIVVWFVTGLDIYLGKKLVRLGDFKIRHKAFSHNCVCPSHLSFTAVTTVDSLNQTERISCHVWRCR